KYLPEPKENKIDMPIPQGKCPTIAVDPPCPMEFIERRNMYKISKERLEDYSKLLDDMTNIFMNLEDKTEDQEIKNQVSILSSMTIELRNSLNGFKLLEEKNLEELEKGMAYDVFPGSNYLDNERFLFFEGYLKYLEEK
ncbi:MAG: hypothetical protein Q8P92_01075, partial [Candidatus Daviesbacteria bacterium]|nr:hypothetical protein [Candidatus Daviesbacteria bacterium]